MSFLAEEILLYLDCVQVAVAQYGRDTRSQIGLNGNVYLAKNHDDKATQVN